MRNSHQDGDAPLYPISHHVLNRASMAVAKIQATDVADQLRGTPLGVALRIHRCTEFELTSYIRRRPAGHRAAAL
jgi:hypothetical protein